jgi:thiol-disulfide isomerase/thioredoxin
MTSGRRPEADQIGQWSVLSALVLLVAFVVASVQWLLARTGEPVRMGAAVSEFVGTSVEDGARRTSSDFGGAPMMVVIWATWCNSCREALPIVAQMKVDYGASDLVVIGMSVDQTVDRTTIAAKARELGLKGNLWNDRSGRLLQRLGVRGIPALMIMDRDARLRLVAMGPLGWRESRVRATLDSIVSWQTAAR